MKVQLLKNVPGIGPASAVVEVAAAHARNFLLPQKLARLATPADMAALKRDQRQRQRQQQTLSKELAQARQRLTGLNVELTAAANPQGTLFAALHQADLLRHLEKNYHLRMSGVRIEPDHWKTIGPHQLALTWPDGQVSQLTITIAND